MKRPNPVLTIALTGAAARSVAAADSRAAQAWTRYDAAEASLMAALDRPLTAENLGAAIQAEIDHSTSLWALKDLAPRWRPSMTDPLSAPHAMYGYHTTAAHGITKCAIRLADMLVDAGVPIPPLAAKPDDRSELATWVADVRALGVG